MIISRTPLRISFVGGGTDLKAFYGKEQGCVVSTSINKYVYIAIHKYFDDSIVLKYSKTEKVSHVNDIQHPLFREALKLVGVNKGVEITSIADIPAGTGLGSSGSFIVGLLNALYAYKGIYASSEKLAREASMIEIEILKEPIGHQDQYAAAYGSLNKISFNADDTVNVEKILMDKKNKKKLSNNLLMFYTGITRKANEILSEQKKNTFEESKLNTLVKMRDFAYTLFDDLNNNNIEPLGKLLHENWVLKKQLSDKISSDNIDKYYDIAMKNGAVGGKILGAGGGGFFLFYSEEKNQDKLRNALYELEELSFEMTDEGSRILFIDN